MADENIIVKGNGTIFLAGPVLLSLCSHSSEQPLEKWFRLRHWEEAQSIPAFPVCPTTWLRMNSMHYGLDATSPLTYP